MILDGRYIRDVILDEVREEVSNLNVKPKLAVIQVGNDDASDVYIKQKKNMCDCVGYTFEHIKLDDDVNEDYVLEIIGKLNNDDSVNGILVQLPLPKHIDVDNIINTILPYKDVDGLTEINKRNLLNKMDSLFSCTALGIIELLDRYNIDVSGKNVVIVGRSNLVGKPLSVMMKNMGAMVTVCHSKTDNLGFYTRDADILVSSVGKVKLITEDMIKDGAVVIDVGINRLEDKLCGDVDFNLVKDKCSYITPVPGGVGPMTVAMLAKNVLKAYKMQNK